MWIFRTVTKLLRGDTLPCPLHSCLPKRPAAWPTEPTEGINTCHQKAKFGWNQPNYENWENNCVAAKLFVSILLNLQKNGWKIWNQSQILSKLKITKINQTSSKSNKIKWTQLRIKIHGKPSWWLNQPLWKICSSKLGSSSPIFRVKIPKIFQLPPPKNQSKINQMMFLDSINSLSWVSENVIGILGETAWTSIRKSCWNHQGPKSQTGIMFQTYTRGTTSLLRNQRIQRYMILIWKWS